MKHLPLPDHYDAARAAHWSYRPDELRLFAGAHEWGRKHGVKPAGLDKQIVRLLLIDVQNDFCLPDGTLYV
ncbi:MAG: nicotinamidase, partial [Parcubacteria group bacterium]|nr:nicotinamidase [Parcubacteria group bacterium]